MRLGDRLAPDVRRWRVWNHDFDTLMHEIVKNPAYSETPVEYLVSRCEALADAIATMQERRRPEGVSPDFDF